MSYSMTSKPIRSTSASTRIHIWDTFLTNTRCEDAKQMQSNGYGRGLLLQSMEFSMHEVCAEKDTL